jgi:DNA/RNA-binding domain of Phe-tRNA-synthetase-like protein
MAATQFMVDPRVFERFPGMRLAVVVALGVDNERERPGVEELWREEWSRAAAGAEAYGNAQSHPRVQAWRERFRAMGVSSKEFPSSIEAVLRRAMKGGEPFEISPLVDFYNAISLRHTVPAGGFDLDRIAGPLELRLTRPGDHFTALDSDEPVDVPPGEVACASGSALLTRHFVWRQARTGLITSATTSAFIVSEVLGELGPELPEVVLSDLSEGLREHFGVSPLSFLVDEKQPSIEW